jgi:hypothetical protein
LVVFQVEERKNLPTASFGHHNVLSLTKANLMQG